jgi:hypothetical protein
VRNLVPLNMSTTTRFTMMYNTPQPTRKFSRYTAPGVIAPQKMCWAPANTTAERYQSAMPSTEEVSDISELNKCYVQ